MKSRPQVSIVCKNGRKMIAQEQEPFSNYEISENWRLLDDIKERSTCPKCSKSRKFFCYTCYVPVPSVKEILPHVSLPIHVDIIKHKREIDGKSTSAHAMLLAPNNVSVYQYPHDICNYSKDNKTILIYPANNSYTLREYFRHNPVLVKSYNEVARENIGEGKIVTNDKVIELPFNRAVFVDGTWNQSKAMYGCLRELPCVVLQSRLSQFWRHQKNSPRWYLATIEAIHQLLTEIREHCAEVTHADDSSSNEYDNLLFFFRYMYHLIHSFYNHNELLSFRRPVNL